MSTHYAGNYAVVRLKNELFRRVKCSAVAKLIENSNPPPPEEEMKEEEHESQSVFSFSGASVQSAYSGISVSPTQLTAEYLLVDLRDPEEYTYYHIRGAKSYPAPLITQDRLSPELFQFVRDMQRNQVDKLIIVYGFDERTSVEPAQRLATKGFENVFLLSGGVEEFSQRFPRYLEGIRLPRPVSPPDSIRRQATHSLSFKSKA